VPLESLRSHEALQRVDYRAAATSTGPVLIVDLASAAHISTRLCFSAELTDGAAWTDATMDFRELHVLADEVAERLDAAKKRLIGLATHTSEQGGGVTVSRYWKAGNVDYKKVPELAGVDLDKYRGPARQEVRVTMQRQQRVGPERFGQNGRCRSLALGRQYASGTKRKAA
jgi:hypothetical protein